MMTFKDEVFSVVGASFVSVGWDADGIAALATATIVGFSALASSSGSAGLTSFRGASGGDALATLETVAASPVPVDLSAAAFFIVVFFLVAAPFLATVFFLTTRFFATVFFLTVAVCVFG
ncbi:MAG: hypothetical protein KZQ76_10880 [Candidatus Thiodiazotropha sp. (ex Epidulcina cf. delphinae)]|nr:hypothetical protein [Candidatus Thiodiazotropha sp. (ex Epidulcina cf. delphinae)]